MMRTCLAFFRLGSTDDHGRFTREFLATLTPLQCLQAVEELRRAALYPVGPPPDFLELLSCFATARRRYVVVGGQALAAAGHPRFTQDLDLLVEPTRANAKRVGAALARFGFPAHAKAVAEQFVHPKKIATLGVPPLQIDLMTSLSGVSFARAWKGRTVIRVGRLRVPCLGRVELIKNKLASGRPKALLDVAVLREKA